MEFLKKTLEGKKQRSKGVVSLLDSRLSGWKPQRSYKSIHVSMLTREDGFCAREVALLDSLKRQLKPKYRSTALQVAFDNGSALHDLCRNEWLRDEVVGRWRCRACGVEKSFSKRPKYPCIGCKRDLWEYQEEIFIDPITGATGSIDFFLDLEQGKLVMCEAKSIDKDAFKELKAPLAEHRVRTQTYLTLIARSERPEVARIELSYARVLYISKGYGAMNDDHNKVMPFKEFIVDRNDKMGEAVLAKAKLVQDYRLVGIMPQGICPTAYHKRAKGCPVVVECFSGKWPVGGD